MIIQIKKAGPNAWYDESVGMRFEAWKNPMVPGVYFLHTKLFVLGEDCEVIDVKEEDQEEELATYN